MLTRAELDRITSVNPEVRLETRTVGTLKYMWVENFLQHPEEFVEYLWKYPATQGPPYITTPGARQYISSIDLKNILNGYTAILQNMGINTDPSKWMNCTNIMWKGMTGLVGTDKPHVDPTRLVTNLWLSNSQGGTAFYRRGDDTHGKELPNICSTDTFTWEPFDGDDEWELYHEIENKFNCFYLFDGQHYHAPHPVLTDEKRYSLLSFYYH